MLDYYKKTNNKYSLFNRFLYLFIIIILLIFIYNYYNNKSIIASLLITSIICILIIPTIRLYLLLSNNNNNFDNMWNTGIIIEHILILFIIYRIILIISDKYLKHADGLQLCDYIIKLWSNNLQK